LVRHPLYATDILTLPAIASVWFNDLSFVAVWFVLIIIVYFAVRIEEKYMLDKFGREYEEYKKRVPSIIPYRGFVKF